MLSTTTNTQTRVRIHLVDYSMGSSASMLDFYGDRDPVEVARSYLKRSLYITHMTLHSAYSGKAAAEDMFDLSNNPGREEERQRVYGRGRSLSVGDIVGVGDQLWLCCPTGWREVIQ